MRTSATTTPINYGKIKRDIFLRDTNGDSRFTTKVGKDAKKYNRNAEKRKNWD
jgi:hypothetical protein